MKDLMKKYTRAFSVSGREASLAAQIAEDLRPFADSVSTDAMGNLIVLKKGKDGGKKLMLAAHMDEIGFIATFIEDSGYIRVSNIGGINAVASAYHKVVFENGTTGVLVVESGTAFGDVAVKKMYVDIGARSKKEAERKVKVGDCLAVAPELTKLGATRYAAKAFDDRLACALLAEVARTCAEPACDTYFVFTVQEEVGCRGSKPAAYAIAPDYAIAVDVTNTGDMIGAPPMTVKLGGGAAIKIKDASVLCSKVIVDGLTALAEADKIPYQYEILVAGGTDTSSMQTAGAGAHAVAVSIPTRYVHSPVEVVDAKDLDACVKLLRAAVERGINAEK